MDTELINESLDKDKISKLTRKIDLHLLPYISILYLFSFLDRVNIGYARLYRMEEELSLSQWEYSWSLSIFFISYVLFEVPSNLVLKRVPVPVWISRIMITWGAITVALAFVTNFAGLMAGRFFLGIAEAGLFPGIFYHLTFWYTRKQIGLRVCIFFSAANFAGAFSGLLAYGISSIDGALGLSGWQWIFIIEGVPSVLFGITTLWLLPDTPATVNWLTKSEKDYIINQLLKDHTDSGNTTLNKAQLREAFTDYKVYIHMILHFGITTPFYSLAQLLPTIINSMGFPKLTSLLLTAPPYTVGVITLILLSRHSDKKMERCYHICLPLIVGIIGLLIMIPDTSKYWKYLGSCIAVQGIFNASPISLSWLSNNMVGSTKSATATAMIVSFSNVGGVVAGQMFRKWEAPNYLISLLSCISLLSMSVILINVLRYFLNLENLKLEKLSNNPSYEWEIRDGINIRDFRFIL